MKSHARAVVIGGGVVGCSVLYHLARAGWTDTLLIERAELTAGSSWHAAGGFHTLNGDPNVAQLQAYTVTLYQELEELTGLSCGLHLTGGVMLADTPERMDFLRYVHATGRALGMETEIITPAEAKVLNPLMDESHFVGALWDPVEGHLDPSGTTHAYARAAQKLGAEISLQNPVTAIEQTADGKWSVHTNHGTVQCEHVVNAGGLWAREVGRMVGLELPVLAMEHMYLLTDDLPAVQEFNARTGRELVAAIDFKGEIYTRQERNGILLGTYERACVPWSPRETPWDFGSELLQEDLDRISPSLEIGYRHFPAFETAGIRKVVNGPFTFAPDGNPLVGPVQGLTNFWSACAVMAGFSQGGGVGLALSNWMVDGDPGFDVFGMDVARYGDFTSLRYTNAKVRENYSRRFSISFPNEELPAARPQQTTPLYDIMTRDNNAVMGDSWGLETPLWFAPEGAAAEDVPSFHRSTDFKHVGREVQAVRNAVGVTEIANFAKYAITGSGARAFLDRLMTNQLPAPGRLCLTPMLNPQGKLIGDFTIACASPERYIVWGSSGAQIYHTRWFEKHLPTDGSVSIHRFGQTLVGLSIAGPASRELLSRLCDWPVDNASLPFMHYREMDVAGCPAQINRISYTGDLGFEIWMEPCYERRIYTEIKRLGADLGVADFGMRALLSMRLEKNFPTWFAELRPLYGPYEADLGRFVKLDKGAFIGRSAAAAEAKTGGRLRRVTFNIDTKRTDVMAHEPIWAQLEHDVDTAITPPHGYGARRFDDANNDHPKPNVQRDGNWQVVGWVTSGGYGHGVGASLAQGYIPASLITRPNTEFEVEILGKRCPATLEIEPLFDPQGARMRG